MDIKSILTVFFCVIIFGFHPCNSLLQAQEPMTEEEAQILKDFEVIETPEKWKDESAVIICQNTSFIYFREGPQKIRVQEISRKRVKLQDKAAVEEFSVFFYIDAPYNSIDLKIIKPNGKEIVVDPSEGVEVTENIPSKFRAYNRVRSYYKLAVPGLEVGDIIDYAYKYNKVRMPGFYALVFDPVILTLPHDYPIMKQIVEFDVDKNFFLNFNSYNGAPELEEVPLTEEQKERKRYKNIKRYKFVDEMREKEKSEKWHFPHRSLPFIKFQVYYSIKLAQKFNWIFFLGESGIPHKKISKAEMNSLISEQYIFAQPVYVSWIRKYLKKYHPNEKDKRKLVELTYYYLRYLVTTYGTQFSDEKEIGNLVFARTMSKVLDKYEISTELNVAVPRFLGKLDEVLFPNEISTFLIAKVGEEDFIILNNFDKFSNLGDIPFYLEGTESLNPSKALVNGSTFPTTSHEENQTHAKTTIDFNEGMDELKVSRDFKLKGHHRESEWNYVILDSEYLIEDVKRHPLSVKNFMVPKLNLEEIREKETKQRLEYLEDKANNELQTELKSYDSFELENDGRYHDAPELKYKESFTISDLLQKAGGNHIVEIGKFIGTQVEITEDMEERHYDIYLPSASSFVHEIELTIPEGYVLEGIEKLNMEVNNEVGMFRSTAKIEGNKLLIEAAKAHKSNYEPKENWSEMVDFLEAAYQFSQQKVVLKKQ